MGKSEKTKSLKGQLKDYELDPDNARVHDEKNRKAVGQSSVEMIEELKRTIGRTFG